MIKSIRNVEIAFGNGKKIITESEKKNIQNVRKSLVAAKKIIKGEIFTEENICSKRPGNGLSPMDIEKVIGKVAKQNFETDELIYI